MQAKSFIIVHFVLFSWLVRLLSSSIRPVSYPPCSLVVTRVSFNPLWGKTLDPGQVASTGLTHTPTIHKLTSRGNLESQINLKMHVLRILSSLCEVTLLNCGLLVGFFPNLNTICSYNCVWLVYFVILVSIISEILLCLSERLCLLWPHCVNYLEALHILVIINAGV